jgi:hypothetical protein
MISSFGLTDGIEKIEFENISEIYCIACVRSSDLKNIQAKVVKLNVIAIAMMSLISGKFFPLATISRLCSI